MSSQQRDVDAQLRAILGGDGGGDPALPDALAALSLGSRQQNMPPLQQLQPQPLTRQQQVLPQQGLPWLRRRRLYGAAHATAGRPRLRRSRSSHEQHQLAAQPALGRQRASWPATWSWRHGRWRHWWWRSRRRPGSARPRVARRRPSALFGARPARITDGARRRAIGWPSWAWQRRQPLTSECQQRQQQPQPQLERAAQCRRPGAARSGSGGASSRPSRPERPDTREGHRAREAGDGRVESSAEQFPAVRAAIRKGA